MKTITDVFDLGTELDLEVTYFAHDETQIRINSEDMPCVHCKRRRRNHAEDQCLFDTTTYKAMSREEVEAEIDRLVLSQK